MLKQLKIVSDEFDFVGDLVFDFPRNFKLHLERNVNGFSDVVAKSRDWEFSPLQLSSCFTPPKFQGVTQHSEIRLCSRKINERNSFCYQDNKPFSKDFIVNMVNTLTAKACLEKL